MFREAKHLAMGLILSVTGASCGSSSSDAASSSEADDLAILQLLYSDQRTPEGFYVENLPDDAWYTISHVKNTDLLDPGARSGVAVYELCSDDAWQARQWSDTAAAYRPVWRDVTASRSTAIFTEFTRSNTAYPEIIELSRVFRCSYLDRSNTDIAQNGTLVGTLAASPPDAVTFRQAVQYLWTFSPDNNYGYAIVNESEAGDASRLRYALTEARLAHNEPGCDTITLLRLEYSLDQQDGEIQRQETMLRQFSGRQGSNGPELCNAPD